MRRVVGVAAATLSVGLAAASAHAAPRASVNARLVDKLASCAEVPDKAERLACYETTAAALKQAVAAGDVVVVDREQAQEVKRQAFGFTMPSLSLFDHGAPQAALTSVSGRLAGASRDNTGRWTFRLEDGAAWTQVDTDLVMFQPKAGMAAVVKKGMAGAYFMSLDGHAGVRVRRVG